MLGFAPSLPTLMCRLVAMLCVSLVAACANPAGSDISFNTETDFDRYRTYSWLTTGALQDLGADSVAAVRATIERTLADKGFRQAADSDFTVSFTASQLPYARPARPRYTTRPSTAFANPAQDQSGESVVTLAISITETATRRSLWRGSTSAVFASARAGEIAPKLVPKILASFPPQ